ncbi:unnamed protein product, partial [Mesorhabditis belari]|uniref:Kynureninase n=1 Tax=Mesorhabditis belari TaxID=2138241 RepID=A0AAF3F018_9BILA
MSDDCTDTQQRINDWLNGEAKKHETEPTSRVLADILSDSCSLKHVREQFAYPKNGKFPHVDLSLANPDEECIYMCGNSLGLMPKATRALMDEQLTKWAEHGVHGHLSEPIPWAHGDECALDGVAKLVGGKSEEVALMNGLTVNVHVLLTAFYKPTDKRHKILLESKAFPSDHYAIESQIRLHGRSVEESMICFEPREGEETYRTEDILDYIDKNGDEIAIIFFSGVQYYTGQLFDIPTITKKGHEKGCLVGWDLAHAFGNVPLELHHWDVDFAAWCSYKYFNTCAGGLAGAFVHERFKYDKRDRMLGWWSHRMKTRFHMDNQLDLDDGAAGYRISNPPVFLVVPVLGMLEVFKSVTMEQLRSKSFYLTGYLEYLLKYYCGEDSPHRKSKIWCRSITPKNFCERGCQLSLKFNVSIDVIYKELTRRGVAVDKRYPYIIRATPVHLYNNFTDIHRFVMALQESMREAEKSL